MKSEEYVVNRLKQELPRQLSCLLTYMKDKGGAYIAGGAITCIATNKANEINDWDIFFPTKEACIEAIRFMKEDNPHVSFVSDKSISYCLSSGIKVQFIYNKFYPKAEDIFKTFDFTIVMGAYDCRDEKLYTHENFWMHNAQRFLSVNTGTSFPILSLLRLEKYRSRGYKFSRNEVLKLSLAVADLNITTWEEAKEQIGNGYGFNLADYKDCENEEFSIDKLMERIVSVRDGEDVPMQEQYLYPHNAVDFLLEGKPIQYVMLGDDKSYINSDVLDCQDGVEELIGKGLLEEVEIELSTFTEGDFYIIAEDGLSCGEKTIVPTYKSPKLYHKEDLPNNHWNRNKVIYRVEFDTDNVKSIGSDCLSVSEYTLVDKVCRYTQLKDFQEGKEVYYRPSAKGLTYSSKTESGWVYTEDAEYRRGRIAALRDMRDEHIKSNILVTGGSSEYAHKTFEGLILEGGEDITAMELLYFMDGWNLSFGGSITIKEDGTFSGRYNTD